MKPPSAKMYTLKEALVVAGLLDKSKAGRGKPSRLMREQAEGLVAEGWNIQGYEVTKGPATLSKPAQVKKVERRAANAILDVPDVFRDEGMWSAYAQGKEIGFRTVENHCGNSLGWCRCNKPTVFVNGLEVMVTFRPRKRKG